MSCNIARMGSPVSRHLFSFLWWFFLWHFYWITNQGQGTVSYCLKSSVFLRINRYPVKQVGVIFNSELFWEHESHLHRSGLSQHRKDMFVSKFVYLKKKTKHLRKIYLFLKKNPHLINQAWDIQFLMEVSAGKNMAVDFNSKNNLSITFFLYFDATWMQ